MACEYSGTVRDAFRARGHDALSVDLLPTESPGPHVQGDALDVLAGQGPWDLLIAHPPCTYLANSGLSWLDRKPGRWELMRDAAAFFRAFLDADVPRIAVENPIPHKHARELIGPPSQYIEPYEYGQLESKKTGLWLRGLPPLLAWEDGRTATYALPREQRMPGWWGGGHSTDSGHKRSRFFPGMAAAMAQQWGEL